VVVGVETGVSYDGSSDLKMDRRYYYAMNQEIAAIAPAQYVIFKFRFSRKFELNFGTNQKYCNNPFQKEHSRLRHGGMGLGIEINPPRHGLCQHDDLRCLRQLGKRNETSLRGMQL
jgi:hypothetical protein